MKPFGSTNESKDTPEHQEVERPTHNGILLDEIQMLKEEVRALRQEFMGVQSRLDDVADHRTKANLRLGTGGNERNMSGACKQGAKARKKSKKYRDGSKKSILWGVPPNGNKMAWTATTVATTLSCAAVFIALTSGHGKSLVASGAVGRIPRNIQEASGENAELFYPDFSNGSCTNSSDGLTIQGDNGDSSSSFQTVEECCQFWYVSLSIVVFLVLFRNPIHDS